jgi:hypothetical protein
LFLTTCAQDGAVYPAATHHPGVGCIHDRIDFLFGDVPEGNFDLSHVGMVAETR